MGMWRLDPQAYKKWSTYKPEGSTPKKVAAKAVAIAKGKPDRFDYALRMFGRAAARRQLKANATAEEKTQFLLDRTAENEKLDAAEARRRGRAVVQRGVAEANRNMLRGGGSINSAQDAIRNAFASGW